MWVFGVSGWGFRAWALGPSYAAFSFPTLHRNTKPHPSVQKTALDSLRSAEALGPQAHIGVSERGFGRLHSRGPSTCRIVISE